MDEGQSGSAPVGIDRFRRPSSSNSGRGFDDRSRPSSVSSQFADENLQFPVAEVRLVSSCISANASDGLYEDEVAKENEGRFRENFVLQNLYKCLKTF